MTATIINGKNVAETLQQRIAGRIPDFIQFTGRPPGLAVILVGNDPASRVYVNAKLKATEAVGMVSFEYCLPETTTLSELLLLIQQLNLDANVDGILVQLPLPKHICEAAVINKIRPDKDVDGFHVINAGKLATGQEALSPCTPLGCMALLKQQLADLSGLHAVVIGRSNIVGKPMVYMLMQANCTVSLCHSHTQNLPEFIKQADIVIAAVGRPELIKGHWLKPGAVVIDVGINRIDDASKDKGYRLIGDVEFRSAVDIASAITPVPNGVGPMTIAMLLGNTLKAAYRAQGVSTFEL